MVLPVVCAAVMLTVSAKVSEQAEQTMEMSAQLQQAEFDLYSSWQRAISSVDFLLTDPTSEQAGTDPTEIVSRLGESFTLFFSLEAKVRTLFEMPSFSLGPLRKLKKQMQTELEDILILIRDGHTESALNFRRTKLPELRRELFRITASSTAQVRETARIQARRAEQLRTLGRVTALISVSFGLLFGMLVRYWFEHGVHRPVQDLARTARAVHTGNIRIKANESQTGELGDLAEAFNSMTSRMSESLGNLKAGEERFRRVLEELPVPTAVIQSDGKLEFVNAACTLKLGYSIHEIPDLSAVWEILFPEPAYRNYVRETWTAEIQAARKNGTPMPPRILKFTAADGGELSMEVHTSVLEDRSVLTMVDITDRLSADAERDQLAAVLEATTDMVSTAEPGGRLTYMNRAGREMIGWRPSLNITGAIIPDIHPPDALRTIEKVGIPHAVEHGSWQGETAVRHADGHDIPVSQVIISHPSETGEVAYLSTIIRDISADKEAETALAKYNAILSSVVAQAPFGIMVAEGAPGDWMITMSNPEAERIIGVSAENMVRIGLNEDGIVGSKYLTWRMFRADGTIWPVAQSPLPAAMRGLVTINEEMKVQTASGRERTTLSSGSPIRDSAGNIIASVVIVSDVTEMKDAQREMVKLRNYLADILDFMPSIIIGVDDRGRVTRLNRKAELETGTTAENAYGRDAVSVVPRLAEYKDRIRETVNSGRPFVRLKQRFEVDNRVRFEDLTIFPVYSRDERGAVIRIDDATDRANMEEILIQSEKMVSVGGLAAGMAHEINNPLGVILQGIQSAVRRLDPGLEANRKAAEELNLDLEAVRAYMESRNIVKYLDGIGEAGRRAAKIVRNMLDFSRKSDSNAETCSLPVLIDTVVELAAGDYDLKKKFDFKRITIQREYGPDTPKVACVRTEMEQVVLNLLKNATQALNDMPENHEPVITLRTYQSMDRVVIEVEDNGPGMSEEVRKRIFEPFFTTKAPGSGTGLGLAVSYYIVTTNHVGEFLVDSTPGKGTKFTIRLPLKSRSRLART